MAIPTNTFQTYAAVGNREDLSDVIYNVDPTDTPFMTSIESAKSEAVLHSWQSDALAAASSANQNIEGDDATADAATATTLLSNTCEIADKVASVSGTQQVVRKAGRKDELAYQVLKKTKELRRDIESSLLANRAEDAAAATTPRKLGAVPTWYTSNVDRGSGGSSGGLGNTVATDGAQRVFTEDLLKNVLRSCWDNGGDPDLIMVGSFNKQVMSGFTGNATRMKGAEDKKLVATIDVYSHDFGTVQFVPNRFQRSRDAHVVQKDMWAVAWLRPVHMIELSKTGDSSRKQILAEYTLESRNQKASGIIADLTTA